MEENSIKKDVATIALALAWTAVAYAVPLKFLTFNIWGDYFGNPVAEREAAAEAAILKDAPDIVALQEVTANWYASKMFANLEKVGYAVVRGADGTWRGSPCPPERDKSERSIDHIYFTKGVRAIRHEIDVSPTALGASDHSPVLLEFSL